MVACKGVRDNPAICLVPALAGLLLTIGITSLVLAILGGCHVIPMSAGVFRALLSVGIIIPAICIIKSVGLCCFLVCSR